MSEKKQPIKYNDLFFRIIISLLAAHIIVAFGATQSLFKLLISWVYYRSLLPSFLIAFLLISAVYLATIKLDKHFDWKKNTVARIGLQLVFGLILPSLMAFILATVYFASFGYSILANTYYLQFDFPVIIILLLLLNVYYLAFYFFRQWQHLERRLETPAMSTTEEKNKEVFIIQKGAKNIPLPIDSISYFYHDSGFNFVRTFAKEDFLVVQPLDEVQQQLNERQFFRANRQMIVNFSACEHFELLQFGKLELIVNPKPKEQVIISQKRAKAFKQWIGK